MPVLVRLADVVPLELARFTYPEQHPLAGQSGVVFGYVVLLDDGVLLADTGIADDPDIDLFYRPQRRDIAAALAATGSRAEAVTAVVNSHLHFDHCGGNVRFPGVAIHVQRAEYEAARQPRYTVPGCLDFPGARYELHEGDHELTAGVGVLATPGHTPGHQSVAITTEDGLVLLAGHAFNTAAEFARGQADAERSEQERASAARLVALRPARVYLGHDAGMWDAECGIVPGARATRWEL